MLDIKFIRENPDLIRDAARKKHIPFDVPKLLEVDEARKAKLRDVEALRAQLNATSDEIAKIEDNSKKESAIENTRSLKEELARHEEDFRALDQQYQRLILLVPNVPDPTVPEGETDLQNREERRWGEKPKFVSLPKDHISILHDLRLADFERGTKVAGFRGYFLTGKAVLLSMALWRFAVDRLLKKGYTPLIAPSLAREEHFVGTGWLPGGKDEIYHTQDDIFLIGTSEVSAMGMYSGEILNEEDLPKKFVVFSPCFRREAGSHGKDTKGLYRVHEFMKVEQVVISRADHSESVSLHEEITGNAEELMQSLGLFHRVVTCAGGDLGLGQVKKYDIETWIPSQERFGETHSSSYFHDFQSRRLNIRYRDKKGELYFVHSLNNTALATPRLLIPLLEQFQRSDGTVSVPEVLQEYTGFSEIRRE